MPVRFAARMMSLPRIELRRTCAALGAAVLLAAGCSNSTSPGHGSVQSVGVTPDSITLTIGGSNSLQAVAQDGSAKAISGETFFWSTSDSLIATVTQSGAVTAHQAGAAQIGASTQGKTGYATVIVGAALVHSVTVSPSVDTIFASAPANSVTLSALTFDDRGQVLAGRPVTWSTTSNLVTVANGQVTATDVAAGSATVSATSTDPGSPSGSATVVVVGHVATVTVTPMNAVVSPSGIIFPQTVQLAADLVDTFGTDVSGQRTVTWSSNNAGAATVSATTGLVTATPGSGGATVTITATTSDGATGSVAVTVFP